MTGPAVFVTALVPVRGEGRHVATATVRIGAVTCRHVKLLRDGTGWIVGFPRRWEGSAYADLISVDKPLRAQVLAAVLAAYQEQG